MLMVAWSTLLTLEDNLQGPYFWVPSRLVSEEFWCPFRCFSQALAPTWSRRVLAMIARRARRFILSEQFA